MEGREEATMRRMIKKREEEANKHQRREEEKMESYKNQEATKGRSMTMISW
jgi:hypothetical protein